MFAKNVENSKDLEEVVDMSTEAPMGTMISVCIDDCLQCYQTCLQSAMNHCLNKGGEHVSPEHFRLMMDCSKTCKITADFLLSSSSFAFKLCGFCADICEACARSCEKLSGMDDCVLMCLKSADSCKKMLQMQH